MSFAKVFSAQHHLLSAEIVSVEVDISKGLHVFSIVGLPDKGVEESRDRVSAAIKNSGFISPKSKNQKVIVSLAPADIRKEGPVFDLAIALAYLLASKEISFDATGKIFLGELSLDGRLCKIQGILPKVMAAKAKGFTEIYVPVENGREAALISDVSIFIAPDLRAVIEHLDRKKGGIRTPLVAAAKTEIKYQKSIPIVDLSDIQEQETAKRGLEIAAAGGHNIVLYGPPGTGKTMLAKAFADLLPRLTFEESLEVASIHSVAGTLQEDLLIDPPFRNPHHTISPTSMIGGGSNARPGEITLAHRGILFLDEFPEFQLSVINALRQPLEERAIRLTRHKTTTLYPANFILIATMNPCPCGNYEVADRICICGPKSLERYTKRLSGPIVDRIDMWIKVSTISPQRISKGKDATDSTASVQERVARARQIQRSRSIAQGLTIKTNSEMSGKEIVSKILITDEALSLLNGSTERLDLSVRAYHRILKLARTIADLDQSEKTETKHILEALQYRFRQKN